MVAIAALMPAILTNPYMRCTTGEYRCGRNLPGGAVFSAIAGHDRSRQHSCSGW